jgi:hypothetical protein
MHLGFSCMLNPVILTSRDAGGGYGTADSFSATRLLSKEHAIVQQLQHTVQHSAERSSPSDVAAYGKR